MGCGSNMWVWPICPGAGFEAMAAAYHLLCGVLRLRAWPVAGGGAVGLANGLVGVWPKAVDMA